MSVEVTNTEKKNLVINKMSKTAYEYLRDNNLVKDNELYFYNEDDIDANYGKVKNLSNPTDNSDAATKGYVDNSISSLNDQIHDDISTSNFIGIYEAKNETNEDPLSVYPVYNQVVRIASDQVSTLTGIDLILEDKISSDGAVSFTIKIDGSDLTGDIPMTFNGSSVISFNDNAGTIKSGCFTTCLGQWNGQSYDIFWGSSVNS